MSASPMEQQCRLLGAALVRDEALQGWCLETFDRVAAVHLAEQEEPKPEDMPTLLLQYHGVLEEQAGGVRWWELVSSVSLSEADVAHEQFEAVVWGRPASQQLRLPAARLAVEWLQALAVDAVSRAVRRAGGAVDLAGTVVLEPAGLPATVAQSSAMLQIQLLTNKE